MPAKTNPMRGPHKERAVELRQRFRRTAVSSLAACGGSAVFLFGCAVPPGSSPGGPNSEACVQGYYSTDFVCELETTKGRECVIARGSGGGLAVWCEQ